MTSGNNDTLYAGNQKQNQPNEEKTKTKNAMIAKILAGTGVGILAGAGAAYAANHITSGEELVEPATEEENQNNNSEKISRSSQSDVDKKIAELEEKERIREQHEQERQQRELERQQREQERQQREEERQRQEEENQRQSQERPGENGGKTENEFFEQHDVRIDGVEEYTLENGGRVNVYSGTVDNHQAVFMEDVSEGRIITAMVDTNDDGQPEESELIDMRQYNMSGQDLATHQAVIETPEMNVIAVSEDVDMNGQTVDMAAVTINDENVILIDASQNGEVDLAISDQNYNGEIEENEIVDVRDAHIPMPTADDITGGSVAAIDDEVNDYSNDADVTSYEV